MKTTHIDLDGPVHVADFGGTGLPLVLVHGLGGSHLNWAAAGPRLARHFRVFAIDLIGFGRTPPRGRAATVEANQQLLDRFVREQIGEPALVAGNSMGGLISLLQTERASDTVRGLVLVNAAIPQPIGASMDPRIIATFCAIFTPGLGELYLRALPRLRSPERMVRHMFAMCCARPECIPDEIARAHVELARERPNRPWANQAYLEAARSLLRLLLNRARFDRIVERVARPTLLIAGAHDRLVPRIAAERLARMRPDWTFAPLAHVGHVPQLEDPEGFTDLVVRWAGALAS
jgi:pimeloyl-ACP methyl ester carboxylesterase